MQSTDGASRCSPFVVIGGVVTHASTTRLTYKWLDVSVLTVVQALHVRCMRRRCAQVESVHTWLALTGSASGLQARGLYKLHNTARICMQQLLRSSLLLRLGASLHALPM
jgi:hypothetical protein